MVLTRVARGLLAAVAAVFLLSACSGSAGPDKATELAAAVAQVDGVSTVELSYFTGGGGSRFIDGNVTLSTSGEAEGLAVLDKVYAAVAPHLTGDAGRYGLTFVTKTSSGAVVDPRGLGFGAALTGYDVVEKYGTTN